jgi:hypothetical protein
MKMTRNEGEIFNSCLEDMFEGANIEDCLRAYPGQAAELEPLLRTSLALRQASLNIQPDYSFKAIVRSHLQIRAEKIRQKEQKATWFFSCYKRLAVAIVSVMVVFLVGGGVFIASANALPDESLYPIKLAGEHLRLAVAFSEIDRAKIHVQFAERRADEMVEMALQGERDMISTLTAQITAHIDSVSEIWESPVMQGESAAFVPAETPESVGIRASGEDKSAVDLESTVDLEEILDQSREETLYILQVALRMAPEDLKPILEQAIENLGNDYSNVISIVKTG